MVVGWGHADVLLLVVMLVTVSRWLLLVRVVRVMMVWVLLLCEEKGMIDPAAALNVGGGRLGSYFIRGE